MSQQFTVEHLFQLYADNLALSWLTDREYGYQRAIVVREEQTIVGVGHLNLIHPHQIQVIGKNELEYFYGSSRERYLKDLQCLFGHNDLVAIIFADSIVELPDEIWRFAETYTIPLLSSQLYSERIVTYLQSALTRLCSERLSLHGVFMDVLGMGVLITGDSGIGKSELALELVSRGHRLIADDAPVFFRNAPDSVIGSCALKGTNAFLEVRGLGILNVQALFGDSAIKTEKNLRLIIHLEELTSTHLKTIDRLQGDNRICNVLGIDIPVICLPVAPGRNLAVLVECAIRNHSLKLQNYNAADDFITHQRAAIQESTQDYIPI